ncbi:hypothetical protein [Desulfobacter postgatei]|jgi:hypothetical protein|nr:hypothetical protein [Desulfobacter postgatei]MDX9964484.1 hypothetical protein [Desulfobacter postgatei]
MCDFFLDWDDIGLAGAMGEEMADEELDRRRLEAELETDEDPEE